MAGKARTPSSAIDRHPRLTTAGALLVGYVVNAALLFGIYDAWPGLKSGSRTTHLALALIVASFGISGSFFGLRREWRRIGLSTFEDWWIVSRCVDRGHAPAEARLWWAADDLAHRRLRWMRSGALLLTGGCLLLGIVFLHQTGPHPAAAGLLGGICLAGAVLIPVACLVRRRRLQQALIDLEGRRPQPPTQSMGSWDTIASTQS